MEKSSGNSSPVISTPLTTFVQADTNSFRELVQRLTGPSDANLDNNSQLASEDGISQVVGTKRPMSKLHERRSQYATASKLEIVKPGFHFKPASHTATSSLKQEQLFSRSKSCKLDYTCTTTSLPTPSKPFSKLSLFEDDREEKKGVQLPGLNREEEEKAIKERRFYLHPSPPSKLANGEPELLPLFPLSSPKDS